MALVLYSDLAPGIGCITLNDPNNLNAMGEAMAAEFADLTKNLATKANTLRALILTGAGRAFSAGGNLEMLDKKRALGGEQNRLNMLKFYESFLGILNLGVPLIAAINGHAVGAGLCVASACDIRIAAVGAKMGFTFTRLGLHPGMGATYFLPRVIGHARAAELVLTGKLIEAGTALNIGLVSQVVPVDQCLPTAQSLATEISSCGPEATRQLLETLRSGPASLAASLEREAVCQGINYASTEFAEGVRAAIEKRAAKF